MSTFDDFDWDSLDGLEAHDPKKQQGPMAKAPKPAPADTVKKPGAAPLKGQDPQANKGDSKANLAGALKDASGQLGINPDEIMAAFVSRHDVDDIIDEVRRCLKHADTQEDEGSLNACIVIAETYMKLAEMLLNHQVEQKKAQYEAQVDLILQQQKFNQQDELHQQRLRQQDDSHKVNMDAQKKLADQRVKDSAALSKQRLSDQKRDADDRRRQRADAVKAKSSAAKKPREEFEDELD